MPQAAKPKKDAEQKKRDAALDEGLEESFSASDPASETQPSPSPYDRESDGRAGDGRGRKKPS